MKILPHFIAKNMFTRVSLQSTKKMTFWFVFYCALVSFSSAELSLPFPALVKEIEPSLLIYSPTGSPKCFKLTGGAGPTTRDISAVANGYNAFDPPANRVIFLVHGFKDNENSEWMHNLKNELVKERAQTVIIVGWGGGSDLPTINYKKALANIKTTAIWLGEIITELRKMKPGLYIWGVGHGLGAHLLGLAGRSSPDGFNRITALDPSAPFLETKNLEYRLRSKDADLVDVIHSDGCNSAETPNCWVAPNNHYQTLVPLGDLDFYPRLGLVSPTTQPLDIYRSHERAIDLFRISITHRGLFRTNETIDGNPDIARVIATRPIPETAEMGYWADTAFVPGEQDYRRNFYVNQRIMSLADKMLEHEDHDNMKPHHHRRRRDLAETIHCEKHPSSGSEVHGASMRIMITGLIVPWICKISSSKLI